MLLLGVCLAWGILQFANYFQIQLSSSILSYLLALFCILTIDIYTNYFSEHKPEAYYFLFANPRQTLFVLFLSGLYAWFFPLNF